MNIRSFSEEIGLSTATISRAFSGRGVIDPATRERVLTEARRLNFTPNILARRLSRQSSGVLGLYYCFSEEPVFDYYNMELAQEIAKAATVVECGLHLELISHRHRHHDNTLTQLASLTQGKSIDGLILVSDGNESTEKLLAQVGSTPTVILSGEIQEPPPCHTQVIIDFEPGIQAAVDHLVKNGHTRIGYFRGHVDNGKFPAITKALATHGLSLAGRIDGYGPKSFQDGERAFAAWHADGLTAVICATDILALGAMRSANAYGVCIPKDFSIIGIDDLAIASYSTPSLSSIGVPRDTIARSVIDILLKIIKSRNGKAASPSSAHTPPPIFIPTYFTARESSGIPSVKI
ncbi:MAG: LacI family DNA-binding transcriptional regulator [Chthoniobacterales bacterium]